ncbi:hypothetical protein AXF42_Ash001740 [Apostasia shenzhenica]|uniref:Calmodulin-binding domain-containing protein n=1 Tax=Apostasia shenzhenica TaxID=1088818 RepID=A0A2I0AB39_9ASPA|nr:hypothetical protein AXF42_Ash001740 [Apostasia shenzhenica]
MVLRKVLDKFRSPRQPRAGSAEPEKRSSKQDGATGAAEDSKKRLKKMRSVRVADLDGLRKGNEKKPQVTPVSATSNKMIKGGVKNPKNAVPSNPISSFSRVAHGVKPAARVLVKNPSLKRPWRPSTKKSTGMNAIRSTCSSTMKDSKIPNSVDVDVDEPDGLCQYSYCSLHGGDRHGAVPVLKRFLSKRVSLKAEESMKVVGHSARRADEEIEFVEDVVNEFFVEIHSKLQVESVQQEGCEEKSRDDVSVENEMISEDQHHVNRLQESCSVTSFEEDCGDDNSELSEEEMEVLNQFLKYLEKGWDEGVHLETKESAPAAICQEDDGRPEASSGFVHEEEHKLSARNDEQKDDFKANLIKFGCEEHDSDGNVVYFESHKGKSCSIPKATYRKTRRKSTENVEAVKDFNPRPPRLLPLQTEPEPEKVNLKHQSVEERRAAEEWMIDFAVRKALRRFAPARKKKVALLVAAFEAVMPQMREKPLSYEGSCYTNGRAEQICRCN